MPAQTLLPSYGTGPGPTDAVVNLLHLKLFHHFQTCTRQTLLFAPEVWDHAVQLCFDYDFLMDATLCVAARHLTILQPGDAAYPAAAAGHLCRALSRFRVALSGDFTSTHVDAFVATCLLLQYEVYASADPISRRDGGVGSFDPARDRIFVSTSSLKQVFLRSVRLASGQESVLLPHLQYNPMDALVGAARISNDTLAKYQDAFSYHRPLNLELLRIPLPYTRCTDPAATNPWRRRASEVRDAPDPIEDGYAAVIPRLCLLLSFLPEAQPPDPVGAESPLLPALARYVLSFPVLCHGPFASMVQHGDPHALLLLYHFYRAVRILLPAGRCWWAHNRAAVSEAALKEWLTRESAKRADAQSRMI